MERGQRSDLPTWRAAHVEALRLARAFESGATVFRRHAGTVKYFPASGLAGSISADLLEAITTTRERIDTVLALAARWDEEIVYLRTVDSALPLDDVQRGHAAARDAVKLLRAALDILARAIGHTELARLDAPYGAGAPRRVHPGAQCTWVAERAEELARAVTDVTLRKENLLLNARVP